MCTVCALTYLFSCDASITLDLLVIVKTDLLRLSNVIRYVNVLNSRWILKFLFNIGVKHVARWSHDTQWERLGIAENVISGYER